MRVDPIPAFKQQLGQILAELLKEGNADDVAALIETDRPRISELRRGKLTRFSLETLIRYLDRLNHRVDVTVTHVRPQCRREDPETKGSESLKNDLQYGSPGSESLKNDTIG